MNEHLEWLNFLAMLDINAYNAVNGAIFRGLFTHKQITTMSEAELRNIPKIGPKRARRVRLAVETYPPQQNRREGERMQKLPVGPGAGKELWWVFVYNPDWPTCEECEKGEGEDERHTIHFWGTFAELKARTARDPNWLAYKHNHGHIRVPVEVLVLSPNGWELTLSPQEKEEILHLTRWYVPEALGLAMPP